MSDTRERTLYRLPQSGKIAGVCSGIADYFGFETWL
ncbi:PspC domain-containing protein, partial [Shewanella sp.]